MLVTLTAKMHSAPTPNVASLGYSVGPQAGWSTGASVAMSPCTRRTPSSNPWARSPASSSAVDATTRKRRHPVAATNAPSSVAVRYSSRCTMDPGTPRTRRVPNWTTDPPRALNTRNCAAAGPLPRRGTAFGRITIPSAAPACHRATACRVRVASPRLSAISTWRSALAACDMTARTRAKSSGAPRSCTRTPMVRVEPVASDRALGSTVYPSSSTASRTRILVAALTFSELLTTRDAVAIETPANIATSASTTVLRCGRPPGITAAVASPDCLRIGSASAPYSSFSRTSSAASCSSPVPSDLTPDIGCGNSRRDKRHQSLGRVRGLSAFGAPNTACICICA